MEKGVVLVSTFHLPCSWVRVLIQAVSRPKEFPKSSAYLEDSDEEESNAGKMPPADSEDE